MQLNEFANKYPTGVFAPFRKSGAEVSFVDFGRRLNVGVAATFLRDDRHLNFPENGAQVASCAVRCGQSVNWMADFIHSNAILTRRRYSPSGDVGKGTDVVLGPQFRLNRQTNRLDVSCSQRQSNHMAI